MKNRINKRVIENVRDSIILFNLEDEINIKLSKKKQLKTVILITIINIIIYLTITKIIDII